VSASAPHRCVIIASQSGRHRDREYSIAGHGRRTSAKSRSGSSGSSSHCSAFRRRRCRRSGRGSNHITWIRGVRIGGTDILPKLLADHGDALLGTPWRGRGACSNVGVNPSYTCATSPRTTSCSKSSATGSGQGRPPVPRSSSHLLSSPRPSVDEKPPCRAARGSRSTASGKPGLSRVARVGSSE